MEQELIDFDVWVKTIVPPTILYYVTYDESGAVNSLYPTTTEDDGPNKCRVSEEFVKEIYEDCVSLSSYRFDRTRKELVKISKLVTHGLTKMDDILHRVIDKRWSLYTDPDIFITYSDSGLEFNINAKHRGVIWDGETEMIFLITEYNDPNELRFMINMRVGDLLEGPKKIEIQLPGKFSVYTRRLFDEYVIEAA